MLFSISLITTVALRFASYFFFHKPGKQLHGTVQYETPVIDKNSTVISGNLQLSSFLVPGIGAAQVVHQRGKKAVALCEFRLARADLAGLDRAQDVLNKARGVSVVEALLRTATTKSEYSNVFLFIFFFFSLSFFFLFFFFIFHFRTLTLRFALRSVRPDQSIFH